MSPSISDDAVREATGRSWDDWFDILSNAESAAAEESPAEAPEDDALDHKALVAFLRSEHPDLSGWWRQMIVVEYEKETGRRVTGETAGTGFQLGVQKTLAASAERVWAALVDPDGLPSWLGADLTLEEGAVYGGEEAEAGAGATSGGGPTGEVRVLVPGERIRLTWQPGDWPRPATLQVRVTPKAEDRATVAVHLEHLPGEEAREAMRTRFKAALAELTETVGS